MRIAIAERRKTDRREPGLRAFQRVGARHAGYLEANGDIVDRGLPGKQRIGLKQIAGLPVEARKRRIENPHRSRGWSEQAGGDIQQRRFSASGRPDNGDELAMLDPEPDLLDRGVDARVGKPKRHRRVVKRDRRWLCLVHHGASQLRSDALTACADKFNEAQRRGS